MIAFWISVAVLTVAVVVLLALPLVRRTPTAEISGAADLAVYRDQLAELERDRAGGLIEPEQAVALEAEIGRRMLAAARLVDKVAPLTAAPARWLAALLAISTPAGALLIYLATGHPELPAQPLAGRDVSPENEPARMLAQANKFKATLKPTKESAPNWAILGKVYLKLGHTAEAVAALRTAAQLAPEDPGMGTLLAEALVEADNGTVGEEAKKLFEAVPADSGDARFEARYYLALADEQGGDTEAALNGWRSLLIDSPADAAWIDVTRAQMADAAIKAGVNPLTVIPQLKPKDTPPAAATATGPGPSTADIDAASKMTPDQRMQMIQGMVAKLAAELDANPDDAAGWRKLANAYQVLGETDKAKNASERADAAERKAGGAAPR